MELKTKISAENNRQDLLITRQFDLPLHLLFKAYVEPDIVAQWMGTNVLKLENKKHGSWEFQTKDAQGNVVFQAGGVIHEFVPERKITRTFQMENAPFEAQLEFLEFEALSRERSALKMHIIYRSVELRDQMLKLPFAHGLNMAHNRLEALLQKSTV
ncbi:MAG: SRPBCC domain-containing protein [Chitinophagaceae bacterium]